jgi:uncharacterized membrane protein
MTTDNEEVKVQFYTVFIKEQDYYSTIWLKNHANNPIIYADTASSWHVLRSYGEFKSHNVYSLLPDTDPRAREMLNKSYIYISYLSLIEGAVVTPHSTHKSIPYNYTELSGKLNITNKIYSNGESEIYNNYN